MAKPLLHPVALAAIAVLVVNDHWLKFRFPGVITGKLSDLAGLIFFPLLVQAVLRRVPVTVAAIATGVGFALVKTWTPATWAYDWGLGALQWPMQAGLSFFEHGALPPLVPVVLTQDATDLVVLAVLPVPVWLARQPSGLTGPRSDPLDPTGASEAHARLASTPRVPLG